MPPGGGAKRKRIDRTYSHDDLSRPSPHRPNDLDLARQNNSQSPSQSRDGFEARTRSGRRPSRGGRGFSNTSNPATLPPPSTPSNKMLTPEIDSAAVNGNMDTTVEKPMENNATSTQATEKPSFHYSYLTDEITAAWVETGRTQIKKRLSEVCEDEDDITVHLFMQELVEAGTTQRLPAKVIGELLKPHLQDNSQDDEDSTAGGLNVVQEALVGAISVLFSEDNPNANTPALAEMLSAAEVREGLLRNELDGKLLEQLGLIRGTFYRVGIRKQTNLLYRQANFNLMREESEGFAKLMTELFTTAGNELPNSEVVENTVEKVKAMIGAFDLDVGRSLDVILDVFGAVLIKQFRFSVKFLRASPWWPRQEHSGKDFHQAQNLSGLPAWALPGAVEWLPTEGQKEEMKLTARARDAQFWPRAEQGGIRAYFQLGHALASPELLEHAQKPENDDLRNQWIRETGTVPPTGNRDAAQLLGFKLRFYSSSTARDPNEELPKNLIYLAALLIKIGFITLYDLYPHIWRSDEEMEELKKQKMIEKLERERSARPGAGAKNALSMAGALADDTATAPGAIPARLREPATRSSTPVRDAEPEKVPTKEVPFENADQKVLLLQSLLAIGALPEALFILGRFPWLIDLVPELPEYIHRILHHSLGTVYDDSRPVRARSSLLQQAPVYVTDVPGLQKGVAQTHDRPHRRTLKWPLLDRDDYKDDGTDYRFYWDEWNDGLPVCQNVADVFTLCKTLLPLVGAKIGQDPSLVLKLARIGKHSLAADDSVNNRGRWLDLIKRVLLPSLSLTKANPGVVNEVFELLSIFPTSVRYLMYLEWLSGRTSRTSDMKSAFDQAKAETRDILKRISKTNVKPMARSLAKVAYANPHIVITTALTQIEVYDSIAEVFVEGARYFTDLGYDVLTWALISSMGRAGRSRVQEGGIFTSRWLSALAHFAGKIYKRYNLMKPGPVLQYVSEQLGKGSSTDLIMLEQIIVSMAGIAPDTNFNDAQLQAMGGGSLLQSQTILQLLDERHASKGSSRRLVKALQDHDLTAKLLISMAQQRQACIFEEGSMPLKAIGNIFDEINRVLGQYLDLLNTNLSSEEFEQTVPAVDQLLVDYDIPAEVAFWISRPIIARRMTNFDQENKESSTKDVNGDTEMADQASSEEDGEAVEDIPTRAATPNETDLVEAVGSDSMDHVEPVDEKWHPVLKLLMDKIQDHVPPGVHEVIGVGFYVTFWQLSLYDINVPGKSYEDEMGRQKRKISGIRADRSNITVSGSKAKDVQVKQLQQLIDDLLVENKQHLKSYSESRSRLQQEKDQWFLNKARVAEKLNTALMEHCFLPRLMSSALDAYFCFKFAKFLHSNGTQNFRTLGFYDLLFKPERLSSLIFMCTSKESDNLGRFLNEILKDLARWHKDKATYEREAFGSKKHLPGFALKVENGKPQILLDYESFRRIVFKWHSNLFSALSKCLTADEYMHVRNAISMLRAISTVYPAVNFHGAALQKAVDKLRNSDKEDLKVASQALLGALHRREKEWVIPQAFRQGQEGAGHDERPPTPKATDTSAKEETEAAQKDRDEEMGEVETIEASTTQHGSVESKPSSESGRTATKHPLADRRRSPSRASVTSSSALPTPAAEGTVPDRRPGRFQEPSKGPNPPRKVTPPPSRHTPGAGLPLRPEGDPRNGHREPRLGLRPSTGESLRPDSRSSYNRHPTSDRAQESYDPQHRYPRGHDRPAILDRDERSHRFDHDHKPVYEERRPRERELLADRNIRPERMAHSGDRDYTRPSERIRQPERDVPGLQQDQPEQRKHDRPLSEGRRSDAPASRSTPSQTIAPSINPERAALISRNEEGRSPGVSIRGQGQDRGRSSRPSSPRRDERREEEPKHAPRHDRDDRTDRRSELVGRPTGPPSAPSPIAPARGPSSSSFNRDGRAQYNRPPVDMQHGRLEPESPQRSAARPERGAESDPPSGPRNRPGPRNNQGLPSLDTRLPTQASDRPPPTAPGRHSRQNSFQQPMANTPPAGPDVSGVHPDRLNQISPSDSPRGQRPPALQTSPPVGPRGGAPPTAPSGPSPSIRGPPSGPQVEGGRGRRHPMATVNNTLAQAAQGPAGRGRGGPRPGGGAHPYEMAPPAPGVRSDFGGHTDTTGSNPNGMPIQLRPHMGRHDGAWENRSEGQNRREGREEDRKPRSRPDDREGHRHDRDGKGDRTTEESREAGGGGRRQDDGATRTEIRNFRPGLKDETQSRKHPRDDGPPFQAGQSRGGSRATGDNKRVRRGG